MQIYIVSSAKTELNEVKLLLKKKADRIIGFKLYSKMVLNTLLIVF